MDYRPKAFNILGTLSRREEGYHQKLIESRQEAAEGRTRTIHEIFDSKERDLDQYLHFDSYRRASFLDHFIAEPMDFESFRRCQYQEEGDFIKALYETEIGGKGETGEVLFSRRGNLLKDGEGHPIRVEKRFVPSLNRNILNTTYQLSFLGEKKARTNFGIEFNINLLAGDASDRYYHIPGAQLEDRRLASMGELEDVSEVHLIDEWNRFEVVLKTDKNCGLWRFPIETVSLSESGFERIFQGSCLLFYWPLELKPREEFVVTVELGIHPLRKLSLG
jgi:alpha-amylase